MNTMIVPPDSKTRSARDNRIDRRQIKCGVDLAPRMSLTVKILIAVTLAIFALLHFIGYTTIQSATEALPAGERHHTVAAD
jgi:hypothetical protein